MTDRSLAVFMLLLILSPFSCHVWAQSEQTLRFFGSNTIGEKLVPELAKAYVITKGKAEPVVEDWNTPGSGLAVNERRILVRDAQGDVPERIEIKAHGSSTGFRAFKNGETDIGMSSRRIKGTEAVELAHLGDFTSAESEKVLALDGLAVIVHPYNPVQALTIEQVGRIFAGEIRNWSEVGGQDRPIRVYARDDNSGTYDTFKGLVLEPTGVSLPNAATTGQTCNKCNSVPCVERVESSGELSNCVAGNLGGIGFIGLAYVGDAKRLGIDECGIAYAPAKFSVKTEEYPLSRRLYLYVPRNPAPFVEDFIEFARSDQAQEVIDQFKFINQTVEPADPFSVGHTQYSHLKAGVTATQSLQQLRDYIERMRGARRLSATFRFQSNDDRLSAKMLDDLDRLVRLLQEDQFADRELMLLGFADTSGDYELNKRLAQRRAEAVASQLRRRGIEPDRVLSYGEELAVACNTNDDSMARNRRVEVWIR